MARLVPIQYVLPPDTVAQSKLCCLDFADAAGMVTHTPASNPSPMSVDLPDIPVARRVAHSVTHHGGTIEDPYAWLRDPAYPQVNDPDVLGYLKAENAYFEAAMSRVEGSSTRCSRDERPVEGR